MIALLAVVVFALGFVLDYADTMHKVAIEQRAAVRAGAWSGVMYVLGMAGTWSVLDVAGWLVAPGALGYFLGSVYAVRSVRAFETR